MESDRLDDCIREIARLHLKGAFGTSPYFREESLDCLGKTPWLESAQFWDVALQDISALYELPDLRFLRLTNDRPQIDFSRLRSLDQMVWNYRVGDFGSENLLQLTVLSLWRYKSKSKDFSQITMPPSLSRLGLYWSDASDLRGLTAMPNLKSLEIGRCRNLKSLADLCTACPNLESLTIEACGKLTIAEAERVAQGLPKLLQLIAANKVLIQRGAV